jgi:predicted nucleic acid-binding protein
MELLRAVYQKIQIPVAVYQEITGFGDKPAGAKEVSQANWIETVAIQNTQACRLINLDPGEAEAIILAQESQADYLLIDERRGRKVATKLGLSVAGTLATLVVAKQHGLVTSVRPILDALIAIAGFRMSQALYQTILAKAGE